MKSLSIAALSTLVLFLLLSPMSSNAQTGQPTTEGKPPIAQPLVREGDFALKLAEALKLGTFESETEAESKLGDLGIAPRNGWIADYPVTPDVIGELRLSVGDAVEAKRLSMGKDDALRALQDVSAGSNLAVKSGTPPEQAPQTSPSYDSSGSTAALDSYYADQGPPIVTYYSPPPDYLYLYAWVPYPFWWWNVWFPGYFVLHDFHRVVHVHRRVEVVSNHFVDRHANRVYRIDPRSRYSGRTYGGIGVPHDSKRFILSGPRGGNETVFRGSHERAFSGRIATPSPRSSGGPSGGSRSASSPGGSGGRSGGGHGGGGSHGGGGHGR